MAYTLPDNVTNYTGWVSWASEVTGGMFGNLLFIGIFFLVFFTFKAAFTTERAFGAAVFVAFILSFFFRAAEMINSTIFFGTLLVTAFTLIWLLVSGHQSR